MHMYVEWTEVHHFSATVEVSDDFDPTEHSAIIDVIVNDDMLSEPGVVSADYVTDDKVTATALLDHTCTGCGQPVGRTTGWLPEAWIDATGGDVCVPDDEGAGRVHVPQ